jgi:hypothetical protein
MAKNATMLEYASLRWWMAFARRTGEFSWSATLRVILYSHSLDRTPMAANQSALGSTPCAWEWPCAWSWTGAAVVMLVRSSCRAPDGRVAAVSVREVRRRW